MKKFLFLVSLVFLWNCGGGVDGNSKAPRNLFPKNVLPCSDEVGENYTGGEFVLIRDVPYFGELVGDLYLPADKVDFPIAVHIHGGAWRGGSRRTPMGGWWGEFLACNGLAVFDIEYTLIPKAKDIIQQVKEIKCAFAWTQTEGKKYGIGEKIIVLGGSAGGHLTALSTLKNDIDISDCPWKQDIKISAAIPFYGVYDFTVGFGDTIKSLFSIEDVKSVSPLFYTQNAYFPFLIIHGTSDFIPLEHAMNFHESLKNLQKDSEIFVVDDAVHAFDVFPENDFTRITKDKIYNFLIQKGIISPESVKRTPQYNHVEKALEFLENGYYKHAYLEFSKEDKISCKTQYGKFLAITFDILSAIINSQDTFVLPVPVDTGAIENLSRFRVSSYKEPDFNFYYENYITPIVVRLDKLEELARYIIDNSCDFYTEKGIPLYLGAFSIVARIGRTFGPELPLFMLSSASLFKSLFFFIFSHDIKIKLSEELQKGLIKYDLFSLGKNDLVGFLREIGGLVYTENPDFLKFKRKELFGLVKPEIINFIRYSSEFIKEAILDVSDNSDVFSVRDEDGDGKLSLSDKFYVGIIEVKPSGSSHWFLTISNLLSILPFLGEDYYRNLASFLDKISKDIESNRPINLGEFDRLIPAILMNLLKDKVGDRIFPEFISFNVGYFLDSQKPLRDFLPEVVYDAGKAILLIENEMGKSATEQDIFPKDSCYYCLPGDRFKRYDGFNSYDGSKISFIADDGISLDGKFLFGKIGIPYAYYKDPSFSQSIFVYDSGSFRNPDLFLLNKAVALFTTRFEKILNLSTLR